MNRFLPSKKLLVFLGITLVVLGCFVLFSKFKDRKVSYFLNTENQKEITKMVNEISQQTLRNDSDGDGLKDWEEILWKTDPQNSDTDGDGTDDNTEILTKRNPLVAGPDDLLDENITVFTNTQDNSEYNKPLTQTDILSRELFTGYVTLKQNNQLGTEQEKQFIDNLVVKNLALNTNSVKKYTLDDLNIIQNADREILLQYVDKLVIVINLGHDLINELNLIKTVLETKNRQELEKLNLNIKIYKKMRDRLLSMKVPDVIKSIHLDGINNLVSLIDDISNMLLIFEDPILGVRGIENYFNSVMNASINSIKIIDYFNRIDIKFNL